MILAELVKDCVTVPMLLERYGVKVGRGGRCACPIHHGKDANMAVKDRWFRCYRCGASGTVIDLQMALSGADFTAAVRELDGLFGLNLEPTKPSERLSAHLSIANHAKAKQDRAKRHEHNDQQYTLLCYLRRYIEAQGIDTAALDKLLDYYQDYTDGDLLPDAFRAAQLLGLQRQMEVMMLAACDRYAAADDDG